MKIAKKGVRAVIPANAGVILRQLIDPNDLDSYPRECGGDPHIAVWNRGYTMLSPRMRG